MIATLASWRPRVQIPPRPPNPLSEKRLYREKLSFRFDSARAKSSKPVLPIRVKLLRATIYGYSVVLSGLKDEELEIRVMEFEEKLKNGILIPKPEEKNKR